MQEAGELTAMFDEKGAAYDTTKLNGVGCLTEQLWSEKLPNAREGPAGLGRSPHLSAQDLIQGQLAR